MNSQKIDVDQYLERIGFCGAGEVSQTCLREIVHRHTGAIPFETLDPLQHLTVGLDARSLQQKLIERGRGGYCYEQNLLIAHVLEELGFRVARLRSRILWDGRGDHEARTHMVLRVPTMEGDQIVDVGFGGRTLTAPISLEKEGEQPTPHETYRIRRHSSDYVVDVKISESWHPLYLFDLQEQNQADYEILSWYLCTHPKSPFRTNLIAARAAERRRITLYRCELKVHDLDGGTTTRRLISVAEMRAVLESDFGIALPDGEALNRALAGQLADVTKQ